MINQDTFYLGYTKGVGKVHLHTVVDIYCSFAFGFLHVNKRLEAPVAVLHNDILTFYKNYNIKVQNILTDKGSEFKGTENLPYELYLELIDIKH